MTARWIGEPFKYRFITPDRLKVGHIVLNMRDGNHYHIVSRIPYNSTVRGRYRETTLDIFLSWTPWLYPDPTRDYGPWCPQLLKINNMYAWTTNPEVGDCITDSIDDYQVMAIRSDEFDAESNSASVRHYHRANSFMFAHRIPIVDGN